MADENSWNSQYGRRTGEGAIAWGLNRLGQYEYSMEGSRNGSDGTMDCSGFVGTAYGFTTVATPGMDAVYTSHGFQNMGMLSASQLKHGDVIVNPSAGGDGHTVIVYRDGSTTFLQMHGPSGYDEVKETKTKDKDGKEVVTKTTVHHPGASGPDLSGWSGWNASGNFVLRPLDGVFIDHFERN